MAVGSEAQNKFSVPNLSGDTFSQQEEVMALFKRDQFPGLERVLECLPHPGQVFLEYYPLYKMVKLKAKATRKGLALGHVDVVFFRDKKELSCKRAPTGRLILKELEQPVPTFKVKAIHKGLSVAEVAEKERNYFQNQAQKILDQGSFDIILSRSIYTDVGFAKLIWESSFLDPDLNPSKESDFHFVTRQDPEIRGLGELIGHAPWDFFVPPGTPHHKFLAILSRWYKNWETVQNLIQCGVSINFIKTWQQCCDDLNEVSLH